MSGIAGDMLNGVALWVTRRERKQERDDDALRAVLTALNTTKSYIVRLARGDHEDPEKEAELVQLWQEAAVRIRRTDKDLGARLQEKAEYWTNPREWSQEDVQVNRIQIDQVSRDVKHLLLNV